MKYRNITEGIFHERLHRFGAMVDIDGSEEYVHVKNTGRCREILRPGTRVFLEKSNNPGRKTGYSIVSAYKGDMLINIDSQVPNRVVEEAVRLGRIPEFTGLKQLWRERKFGGSRLDFYFERPDGSAGFMEVKGVTLDDKGTAMFPDAPTERGLRHLNELMKAQKEGFESWVFFLIQYSPAEVFVPNHKTDPAFSEGLKMASGEGVGILAYDSLVEKDSITAGRSVRVSFY